MKQLVQNFAKYLLLPLVLVLFSLSCNTIDSEVPDIPFTFEINLNLYNNLVPGNALLFKGVGYGGVIVSCESPGRYYAYDATCTEEISQDCTLELEGILGVCPCCQSKYILIGGGYPTSGPAAAPLRPYNVSQVNSFTLRVYN